MVPIEVKNAQLPPSRAGASNGAPAGISLTAWQRNGVIVLLGKTGPWRRGLPTRVGAAAIVGVVAAFAVAGAAMADPPSGSPAGGGTGVAARVTHDGETGIASASQLTLTINGKKTPAYCIDFQHPVTIGAGINYQEESWNGSRVPNLKKIQWILTNSYPTVAASKVAATAGAKVTGINDERLQVLVYAATQVSIWHFSDDAKLAPFEASDKLPSAPEYAVITAIYDDLTAKAATSDGQAEPGSSLKITPGTASAPSGQRVGPFTVVADGGPATITVEGGKAIDKDGNPVTALGNGGQFWVTSNGAASLKIGATSTGKVPTGRVFVAQTDGDKYQKLILAGVAESSVKAAATAAFTPAGPQLPVTGASVTVTVAAGIALLLVGVALAMSLRRRRVRFAA